MILHFHQIILLRFRKTLFGIECNSVVEYKIMTINDQIRDEKLQYDINREAAIVSALSSDKNINMNILLVKIYYHPINSK